MSYATVNPFTGKTVTTFNDSTDAEVNLALDNAQKAFESWKNSSFAKRAAVMHKAAEILRNEKSEYAKLLTLEMGKITAEAEGEVDLSADIFDYYAEHAESHLAPRKLDVNPATKGEYHLLAEPLGVLLAIEPWNFPYYQVARIIAPQLSAGNTVLLKHASIVPQSAAAMEKLLTRAGLPAGVFKNLYATRDQLDTIISDPRVRGVALTGSERAGAVVAVQAAKALKKSTLELGGNDAFIVLADAELDKTVKWGVFGRHFNGGQVCCASKRMIIVDELYDQYREKYIEGVKNLKAGDPFDPETTLAPLSSQKAADLLKKQIAKAIELGATATEVGPKIPKQGAFVQPVILENVTLDNPARYWEFFGPVSMLFRAKDEEDAIAIANDTPFGLGGSVFTSDLKHGEEVARKVSTGMVFVNHPTVVKADIPFGGIRNSGYGRELLDLGIKEFVNHKVVGVTDIDGDF
ncbi:NAD-dependent succinate-semialdehyde dehydrogenase [Desulfovibrio gilichinskyi]|uniref:Succinate-semialdehyde dehydrogenase / glutarate-semialdehyde dehydrogenase n=1 Tax=Desulfovibrio gilichinskyi TaxID=1519643 RepID=A0A1X7DEE4_9BACT|nr:NAD-dependent succinate-semialdehyde dehydrogenase [Desulfovibrio gilichinskyi]SMF13664.1 succinate-semialdehyde dehydrogenase / glutarate-semialdehyde dehydrogenase [Desulfovibrio gilichinskyi]